MSKQFHKDELANSKRIQKSATPKYDLSWYIKWCASCFILTSAMFRVQGPQYDNLDTLFSFIGVAGWMVVGLLWKDRALMLLNGVGIILFLNTLIRTLVGA